MLHSITQHLFERLRRGLAQPPRRIGDFIKPTPFEATFRTSNTAQRNKHDLVKNQPELLLHFETAANDGGYYLNSYRSWKRRALSIEWRTGKVNLQKPNYIIAIP